MPKMYKRPPVVAVDIDGLLCRGNYWGKGDPKVIRRARTYLKEIFPRAFIVINTARRYSFAKETLLWLDRNNIPYHAIHFEKVPAEFYIDDRNITFENLLKKLK